MTILRLLDDERRAQGMSQADLGERVGVSQSQMSKLLLGSRAMTMSEFLATCAALDLEAVKVVAHAEDQAAHDFDVEVTGSGDDKDSRLVPDQAETSTRTRSVTDGSAP